MKIDIETLLNDKQRALDELWNSNDKLYNILKEGKNLEEVREKVFNLLNEYEKQLLFSREEVPELERANARECIRIFRNIIAPHNERRTGVSSLKILLDLAKKDIKLEEISEGFILEFIHLFKGIKAESGIYDIEKQENAEFLNYHGREAAQKRMEVLERIGASLKEHLKKYPSGLESHIIERRKANKQRILEYFKGKPEDWEDHKWHLRHVIKTPQPLFDLIDLTDKQKEAVKKAVENRIPFGITPYYLSLMDKDSSIGDDHAVRAQVIPPPTYVNEMVAHKSERNIFFDFMGEHDTSPIDLITRRYPLIAILKPFNTCSQICVYCQRNWEIDECLAAKAMASWDTINKAIDWIKEHKALGDILITGGDPGIMTDKAWERILSRLAEIPHIYRIRIGTRTPVVLPFRWTDNFVNLLAKYHEPGKREIAIVTHYEHSYEITPESRDAVQKIRKAGMAVYNQEVFTLENSRKFETVKLRLDLRSIGVDPYYNFNMKGKKETEDYMVPIARILQERKEEARLLPGLDRTDESVFNVPKLGKNHLRSWQDHSVIMIKPDGCRVYEFHPWEKNIALIPPYIYTDVPIHRYLKKIKQRGENIEEYRTIWYYF